MKNATLLSTSAAALLLMSACGVRTDLVEDEVFVRTNPAAMALLVGESAQLAGELYVRVEGEPVVFDAAALRWQSEDPSVLSVGEDGQVTARAPGQTRAFAVFIGDEKIQRPEDNALSSLITVVDSSDATARIEIDTPPSTVLSLGDSLQLGVTVETFDGRVAQHLSAEGLHG
ncbi:MAG: hypothetical protein AAFQ82_21440, partial [Myxococcota bacterium]